MRKRKIDPVKLEKMLSSGKPAKDCAKHFGVTPAAISKAKKELGLAVTKNVVLESAPKVVKKNLDVIAQLQKTNADTNEVLDLLMRWNRGDPEAIRVLESQVKRIKFNNSDKGDVELSVKEIKFKDPRELALKAMAEIRNQLKLQLDIFQALYDINAVKVFQEEVLAAIGEASPDVRDAIIHSLRKRNAVRQSLSFG